MAGASLTLCTFGEEVRRLESERCWRGREESRAGDGVVRAIGAPGKQPRTTDPFQISGNTGSKYRQTETYQRGNMTTTVLQELVRCRIQVKDAFHAPLL